MATNVSITCHGDARARAYALSCENGDIFIVAQITDNISIYLKGYNAKSIAHARELSDALLKVAKEVEDRIARRNAGAVLP